MSMFDDLIMKQLLTKMFEGWLLHEQSWDYESQSYSKLPEACMIEAAGGNEKVGLLMHYFSYWCNDIESVAAHYGVGIKDGKIVVIPPAPDPNAYWYKHKWNMPDADDEKAVEI